MRAARSHLRLGLIKRQAPDFRQIERQLRRAKKDLKPAARVAEDDAQWAATIAYQSMLRAGRALLYAQGFLPAGPRQHKTVVELTEKMLGDEYKALVRRFERLRRKRNLFFYESEESITETETRRALEASEVLLRIIRMKVREFNPQTSFE